jgi:hypothetical protein
LKVLHLDRKSHILTITPLLEWRSRPNCGIKGDVVGLTLRRTSLDIAASLPFGPGTAATPTLTAGELIQRRIQTAGYIKLLA